jgi:DNA-binding NtrC family response regulator
MPPKKQPAVITYPGLDGACAAAVALLAHPKATVYLTSAARIGETLAELTASPPPEVLVCGVGVYSDWGPVQTALRKLRRNRCRVTWHCGRGYLNPERFTGICRTAFVDAETNTAGMAESLKVADRLEAHTLTSVAALDPRVTGASPDPEPGLAPWVALVDASLAQYLKYRDESPYLAAVRTLAAQQMSQRDQELIEEFRRTGYQYVLHGRANVMRTLRKRIQKCADANRHVLITGESGVGKEHVAHLLRERSNRAQGPFVAVNCALYAGNAGLANSDLFGHVKGAFTGANADRNGRFVEADGGVLYLDELGELPLLVQAKLLRVLEDGCVTPEGADRPHHTVRVRIFAATNRDLPAMIRAGEFRADLYHRLATLRIHMPPLRQRAGDIPDLVGTQLQSLRKDGYERTFSRADLQALKDYDWPGNVRQLIKLVDRVVLLDMSVREALEEERQLGELVAYPDVDAENAWLPATASAVKTLREVTDSYAHAAWLACDKNYTATAKALGISTNTLRYTHLSEER